MRRDPEHNDPLQACEEFVPWSPVGQGFSHSEDRSRSRWHRSISQIDLLFADACNTEPSTSLDWITGETNG
jgi:hypothetical protein